MIQIGSNGTVGQGIIRPEKDGKSKERQIFNSPNGSSRESGHVTWFENGVQHSQAYSIENGEWKKTRYYKWILTNKER
ncbi:MAG: hypothetical protein QNJ57_05900 [Flavobacteriaceae bacterium]|nr:hypothetical protein [Flavobacteriaceae bacterium]